MDYQRSPSSTSWSCSSGSHTTGDIQQIQDLKLQNQHLQSMVTQLQNSLEKNNIQLKSALSTALTVTSLQEEITKLRQKCKETAEESNKKVKNYTQQIIEITKKYESEKAKLIKSNETQAKEIQKLTQSLKETRKERDLLADEIVKTKDELKSTLEKTTKVSKQKQNVKKQASELTQQCNELNKKYNSLIIFHEQISQENTRKGEEIKNLDSQLSQSTQENKKLNDQISNLQKEKQNSYNALDELQRQFEDQKEELNQLSEEREKLLLLIHKLHSTVCSYEEELETKKAENAQLKEKAKKAFTPNMFVEQFNINDISFPFDEEMMKKINTIIAYDHFQSQQKVQLIINEVAKELVKLNQSVKDMNEEAKKKENEFSVKIVSAQKAIDLLQCMMREWKNLECNERKIDVLAFCEKDQDFISFIAQEFSNFNNASLATNPATSLFIPPELLSEEGVCARKKLIEEMAATNKDFSSLMSIMFLINIRLKKQVNELLSSCEQKSTIESTLSALGVNSINEVPDYVESLLGKIEHLKNSRKEVHVALVSARDELQQKSKEEENLNNEVHELKQRVENLTNSNNSLQQQLSESNEGSKKSYSASPLSVCSHSSTDSDYQVNSLKEMQEIINNKSKENEELKEQMKESEKRQTKKINKLQKKELLLKQQIQELENALTEMNDVLTKAKKKTKTSIAAMKEQSNSDINKLKHSFQTEKELMQTQLDAANEKSDKSNAIVKQLQETLSQAEQKNKELTEENTRMTRSLQQIEGNIKSIQDKCLREQKSAEAALTVKLLNSEAQHQRESKELKAKYEAEKQKTVDFFTSHLESLYGFTDIDTDEVSLLQLFSRLQSDLSKLKYFQDQATKY